MTLTTDDIFAPMAIERKGEPMTVMPISEPDVAHDAMRTVLTFRLGRQTYAIPIEPIVQLIEMVSILPLPQMNGGIEGIINVRGTMVPVVSLRYYVGLEKQSWGLHTPIILLRLPGERVVGLIVDEVLEVVTLREPPAPPSAFLPSGLEVARLLQGVAYHDGCMTLLLDHERLFSAAQEQALIQAADATAGEMATL